MPRQISLLEVAILIAVLGSLLAVLVPSFVKHLQASHLSEAVSGIRDISVGAIRYAGNKMPPEAFPPKAPLTPSVVHKGERLKDPPGTWDHLTWHVLGFSMQYSHYYSFAFDSFLGEQRSTFVAKAHGDLDGDGVLSTFELMGESVNGQATILPGLYVDKELE